MKKRYALLLTGALAFGGLGFYNSIAQEETYTNIKIATASASYQRYQSIDELEEEVELVVIGRYTGDRELYFRDADHGGPGITLSKSSVEIEKVLKGDEQKKKTITVFEEGYIKKDYYVNTEGYKWMNENGKYLLFLIPNRLNDTYVIVGMHQGKYDLNLTNRAAPQEDSKKAFLDSNVEYMGHAHGLDAFYQLKEQAKAKYKL